MARANGLIVVRYRDYLFLSDIFACNSSGRLEAFRLAEVGMIVRNGPAPVVVGIGGTTRSGSTSERLVAAVLRDAETQGAVTKLFGGTDLMCLPHYAPERSERCPEQRALVEAVRNADGIVIGTPGYHGGISGLVKNAIDLLEDLRND